MSHENKFIFVNSQEINSNFYKLNAYAKVTKCKIVPQHVTTIY